MSERLEKTSAACIAGILVFAFITSSCSRREVVLGDRHDGQQGLADRQKPGADRHVCLPLGCMPQCPNGVMKDVYGCDTCKCNLSDGRPAEARSSDLAVCRQASQHCIPSSTGAEACCPGLYCCSGMPVQPGNEFCGTVCPVSDRNLKQDIEAVNPTDILDRLCRLPISRWRYRNEPEGVRHVGPMAQDFREIFALGTSDRFIAPVDADGVALASVQALHQQLRELRSALRAGERERDRMRRELEQLRSRLRALERAR